MPIPKKGKYLRYASGYRPISFLSSIAKIFDRIVLRRLKNFADDNNIINNVQFGFRVEHSTTHRVKRVVNFIPSNKNRG